MLLLRCISDSIDFEGVLALLDRSESPQLTLPLGWSSILLSTNSVESAFSLIYSVPRPPGYARTNLCHQARQGCGKGNSELDGCSYPGSSVHIMCLHAGTKCSGEGIIHTPPRPPASKSALHPSLSISINRSVIANSYTLFRHIYIH